MNPLSLFRKPNASATVRPAHITWAQSTVGRTASRAGVFFRKQIWIRPIILVLVLGSIVFFVRSAIESTMREDLRSQLQTLLTVETAMLENWFHVQESHAQTMANDLRVKELVDKLLESDELDGEAPDAADLTTVHRQLQRELGPAMSSYDYVGYFVADKAHRIISASDASLVGQEDLEQYRSFLNHVLQGETIVSTPFPSVVMLKDESGELRNGLPTMFVCAPVRDVRSQVVAALALRIRPDDEFTRIMQLGRVGDTGETYAFDASGLMVSNSRFDEDLILMGLLPDQADSRSILGIQLRDPQGDVTAGFRPRVRRAELPLTRMAADALAGHTGVDVDGYRDYRGVPVVGAWTWLSKYDIGVTTEIDVAEAYHPLTILQRAFWSLYALLGLTSIAIFVFMYIVDRLRRKAQKAEIEAQHLGQYTLETKLGSGAMGVVYKGFHAMLRRPTAIKMLDVDKVNDASIARFEREVQITCRLNHPATIAIYDYGRTPEGVFYYAMEYLDGITLQTLVERYGPQPESRVIHILGQICGSLYEAHALGLVHRDIKPANIMLNRRGAEPDVVKVLDFGLVKAVDEQKQSGLTAANSLTGTPLYMSPEAIESPESVDSRSDLYAVGGVGYFLLTGQPVFTATSLVELVQQHVAEVPPPPSQRLGKPVSSELEAALLSCLEKSRARRPQTARNLAEMLRQCPASNAWSVNEADAWWGRHERGHTGNGGNAGPRTSDTAPNPASYDRTVVGGQTGDEDS